MSLSMTFTDAQAKEHDKSRDTWVAYDIFSQDKVLDQEGITEHSWIVLNVCAKHPKNKVVRLISNDDQLISSDRVQIIFDKEPPKLFTTNNMITGTAFLQFLAKGLQAHKLQADDAFMKSHYFTFTYK